MAAYAISEVEVLKLDVAITYGTLAAAAVAAYGGRYLARGAEAEVVEGAQTHRKIVIIEFPSLAQAHAWYESPEYAAARTLRAEALDRRLMFVEGVAAAV
jgi:uncharacterized protein (DUF1330 family)